MFLVHGASLRRTSRRGLRHVRIYGRHEKQPTYEEVSSGTTGHAESVQVLFDPRKVGYAKLLEVYWHNVDPTVQDQQFCDHGHQYRSAIFYHDAGQRALAEASKNAVQKQLGRTIYTEIVPASAFWPAEEYHQHYYKKNPIRYKFYRSGCGRDARLQEIWGATGRTLKCHPERGNGASAGEAINDPENRGHPERERGIPEGWVAPSCTDEPSIFRHGVSLEARDRRKRH